MSYQPVRGYFEKLTYDALLSSGVAAADIHFANFGETAAPSDKTYAVVALSFGRGVEDVVGCEGQEALNGSISVNVHTPKQQGSKPGEDICWAVIRAWLGINKRLVDHSPLENATCKTINGPLTLAPDARPHHVNVISCVFRARVA